MTEIQKTVLSALTVGVVISLITSMLMLAQPIYMIQIMMNVMPSRNMNTLIAISLVIGLAYVTGAVLDYFRMRILEAAALRIEAIINHKVIRDYLTGSDEEAMNIAAVKDVTLFRTIATSRVATSLFELVFVPVVLAVLFFVSVPLGLAFLAGIVVYVSIVIAQELAMRQSRPVLSGIGGEAGRYVEREMNRSHMPPGTVQHGAFARRYLDANRRYMEAFEPSRKLEGVFSGLKTVARLVLQSLILGVGAFLAIEGHVEIGVVIGVSLLSTRALAPIDGVVGGWSSIIETRKAILRLSETLRRRRNVKPKLPLPRPAGHLLVQNLTYETGSLSRPILRDVNLEVKPGEAVAIIGMTTSGKSTLLRMLTGGLSPTHGAVRLDGNELRNWSRTELELYTGYMPQENQMLDGTVAETIARYDPGLDPNAVVQAAADAGMHEIILGYPNGYNTPIGPNGMPLAAGHRQFIALARALYRRPPVVLLDEPNASLDAEGDRRLAAVLAALKQRQTTVVLVTQRPGLLEYVDRVVVMNNGAVQMNGLPGEVTNVENRRIRPV
jgi:PrtD family type I secretion system ABC transporter